MKYGNKEIKVVRGAMGNHFALAFTSGGELPADLSGLYTTTTAAEAAVELHLRNKKPKGKASANSSGQ